MKLIDVLVEPGTVQLPPGPLSKVVPSLASARMRYAPRRDVPCSLRRSRVTSARSSLVSGPVGSFFSSISARFTQARTAVSVSSNSLDTCPTLLPLVRTNLTTSALYSGVNFRRFRRPMDHHLPHVGGVHKIGVGSIPRRYMGTT
ncbi:MAG TPA: hypothetical protein VN853_20080 [Polyangia bacterium]|nr:hypothetical protein [Polyangia bacterium]